MAMALYSMDKYFSNLDNPIHEAVRVQFRISDISGENFYYPEAVLCSEMYAEQIESEKKLGH